MIYLLQILTMIEDLDLFEQIFSDLDFELKELGWEDEPEELINDLLMNHFDLVVEDEDQLLMLTSCLLKPKSLKAAITVERLKRE